jgi:hypothetical protein
VERKIEMKIFTGVLYVILYLWSLFHVPKAIDVKQDLAPQQEIFKENSGFPYGFIKVDVPGNTVTESPGGLSKWVQNHKRYPA